VRGGRTGKPLARFRRQQLFERAVRHQCVGIGETEHGGGSRIGVERFEAAIYQQPLGEAVGKAAEGAVIGIGRGDGRFAHDADAP
jgi:hypothetical protein